MTDEYAILRDALIGRLASHDGESAWDALGDAGVWGLCVPEELQGLGLTVTDATPVIEALAHHCLPTSFLETSIVAARLLASARCVEGDAMLRAIATDGLRVAVAGLDPGLRDELTAQHVNGEWTISGTARIVLDANVAGAYLAVAAHEGAPALFLLRGGPNLERRSFPTIDGRNAADVTFRQVPATLLAIDGTNVLADVTDEALACLAIEAATLMQRLVHETIAYTKQREQFGQPIARFQAVQHRLVDMNIQARRAAAIARRAMASLAGSQEERQRVISAAKVTAAQTGRFIGQQAIQLHGGMGMTMDLPIGRCFKRLSVIERELGSADDHMRRFAGTLAA